jgi:flagellar hook-associated protein 2
MAITAAGIGSNLDVEGLVSQLMALERRPAARLQGRISSFNSNLSEYGRVRSDISALQSAARGLATSTGFNVFSATLSDSAAGSVAVSSDAAAGQYAIRVLSLARAQTLVSPNSIDGGATRITDANAVIAGSATLTITQGGSSFAINLADSSLAGVRDAINAAQDNTGVVASIINDGSGSRLVLRSEETGAAQAVTSIAVSGTNNTNYDFLGFSAGTAYSDTGNTTGESVAAADAQISVDGVTITSTTNAFSGAVPGVTFVAKTTTTGSFNLTVARDDSALVDKVKAFVTAYNTLVQANDRRYAKGGALAADSTVLSLTSSLRNIVGETGGSAGNSLRYLVEIGISVDKDGVMSLNAETLRSALTDRPEAVSNLLTDTTTGIFKRFDTVTTSFLSSEGLIDSREAGLRSSIRSLEERIEGMQKRLESVEARFRREFSTLDALMARLSQTSAALSRTLG